MERLRDDEDAFVSSIESAEGKVKYPASIILKDYWLCVVLRELRRSFPGTFMLKGGTSLSKGWNLIHRMSEDVDILVRGKAGESRKERKRRLKEMSERTAQALELAWSERSVPGEGRHAHRCDLLSYDTLGLESVGVDASGVLLEVGFGDGWEPNELIDATPLLAQAVEGADAFSDLQPVEIAALKPVRTLIEKLHALHSAVVAFDESNVLSGERRLGRHYYDIYCCLGDHQTLVDLRDRGMAKLFEDVERISRVQFKSNAKRPSGGYAESPAFQPGRTGALRERLESTYAQSKQLMRIDKVHEWPSFGSMLKRIEKERDKL